VWYLVGQQGLMKENGSTIEVLDHGHPSHHGGHMQGKEKPVTLQTPQDFLKLLSTRALEALAQTPPNHHGRAAGGELGFETSNHFLYFFHYLSI
jgi:hypothetical protein